MGRGPSTGRTAESRYPTSRASQELEGEESGDHAWGSVVWELWALAGEVRVTQSGSQH